MSETVVSSLEYEKNRIMDVLDRSIILTRGDPLERLEEFCEQGLYEYEFHNDEFQNGVISCLELKLKGGQTIIKEARFVKILSSDDKEGESLLVRAKKTVTAVLLDRLGLGVSENEEGPEVQPEIELDTQEDEEGDDDDDMDIRFQELASKGLNAAFEVLNKVMSSDLMKDYNDD